MGSRKSMLAYIRGTCTLYFSILILIDDLIKA